MLAKVKGFFKVNVKAVVVSMMIAMITVLSAISCFAEGETTNELKTAFSNGLTNVSSEPSAHWVAPFGYARIKTCLQFPEPFRSLPRPSSPPDSLGIRRSLFVSFLMLCTSHFRSPLGSRRSAQLVNHF